MTRLRVVTFNVGLMRIHAWGCTLFENPVGVAARAPLVAARMERLCRDADLVCVQECYEREHRATLVRAMGAHPHLAFSTEGAWLNSGLMVFSKHPIAQSERIPHGACCSYERVMGDRSMLAARIRLLGPGPGFVNLLNVHLTAGVPPASEQMKIIRTRQLKDISDKVRTFPRGEPIIVAGDFNFSPEVAPENYREMSGLGLRDAWLHSPHPPGADEAGITWDADNPLNRAKSPLQGSSHRCDQVWVGGGARAARSEVVGSRAPLSDHYGVAVDIDVGPCV